MGFELKELSCLIFKQWKKTNPKGPDHRGELLINGKPYEIALWDREGAKGPFLSCTIQPKRERTSPNEQGEAPRTRPVATQPGGSTPAPSGGGGVDDDSDVPF